ncbi:coat protein [Helicobasidium mompa totivirus 1-17]|uniref:Coat protein n=1 Tax=Helicobasidium mompa totivirus 1-17 TaxID=196690 RepID=Q76L28_9VIRU|nr:coat protein [Helicobasidium mompa totivirus 1-17]BAC81753.1 coat protein [Helicobasidium mompa totivirus 1-17]
MSSTSETNQVNYLAGVIANPRGGQMGQQYRSTVSTITTMAKVNSNADSRSSVVKYEIGRRHDARRNAFAPYADEAIRVDVSYDTPAIMSETFAGLAKKYSNFSASFERSSLAGIVERLAKVSRCKLLPRCYIGGFDRRARDPVTGLATHFTPVSSLDASVFIPRRIDTMTCPGVFAVLCAAVAGEGSQIVTDLIEINVGNNHPIVTTVDVAGLPAACVGALRVLGANMIAAGQGDLFGYAVARGIHQVVSVVGHTDEGGVMRDLLRVDGFGAPFGGIHFGLPVYTGLPHIDVGNDLQLSGWVDGIALSTAALVAHCDHGVVYNGTWFPTTLSGSAAAPVEPGLDAPAGDEGYVARNRNQLADELSPFSLNYANGLAKLFGAGTAGGLTVLHLSGRAGSLADDCRHLNFATANPFFWIESTSILPANFLGTQAETEGRASYGGRCSNSSLPLWNQATCVSAVDSAVCEYTVEMASPRRVPFMLHWNGNPRNGLGNILPRQMDPMAIIQPGGAEARSIRERMIANNDLASYLWTRGQSPIAAPGEFMNTSINVGILVKHCETTWDGAVLSHLPSPSEFTTGALWLQVGRPTGVAVGPLGKTNANERRARTAATNALLRARHLSRGHNLVAVNMLPLSFSAPSFGAPRVIETHDNINRAPPGGGSADTGVGVDRVVNAADAQGPLRPTGRTTSNGCPSRQGDQTWRVAVHGLSLSPSTLLRRCLEGGCATRSVAAACRRDSCTGPRNGGGAASGRGCRTVGPRMGPTTFRYSRHEAEAMQQDAALQAAGAQ